ncbi:MAG: DUF308 domain-containing protein [Caldilineaceae bacterium]|nr:DUF308 domain-containing protein [Caldilineaceae bacterium]
MSVSDVTLAGAVRREVARNWWVLLIQGIAAILLGILLFVNPVTSLVAIAFVLGIYWIVGGIAQIVSSFNLRSVSGSWFWTLIAGIISVIAGFLFVTQPLTGAAALPMAMTLLLGLGAIISGIFYVVGAIQMRNEISGEGWMIAWGIISVILGIWILTYLGAASMAYVYVAAVFAIIGGIISVVDAFRVRSLA